MTKFTMREVKEMLARAIGEAFARLAKEKVTGVIATPVKMKDWLGNDELDLIPDRLAYNTAEDFIYARFDIDKKYSISYVASDDFSFAVTDECYEDLVERFIAYFISIYKA